MDDFVDLPVGMIDEKVQNEADLSKEAKDTMNHEKWAAKAEWRKTRKDSSFGGTEEKKTRKRERESIIKFVKQAWEKVQEEMKNGNTVCYYTEREENVETDSIQANNSKAGVSEDGTIAEVEETNRDSKKVKVAMKEEKAPTSQEKAEREEVEREEVEIGSTVKDQPPAEAAPTSLQTVKVAMK